MFGGFMNAGQLCMSTERVLVRSSEYETLLKALRTAWGGVEKGQTRVLFNEAGTSRARALIDDALSKGAKEIFDDQNCQHDKVEHLISPTMVGPVTREMKLFTDETFAPVVAIIVVRNKDRSEQEVIDEMIRIANESDYGLTASVWGRDTSRAADVARRLEVGAVHINRPVSC